MLSNEQQKAVQDRRNAMDLNERKVAALEQIADQLAFIDARLFQIQNQGRR